MQTDVHPVAHFVTRVVGINDDQNPFEVEVIIRRAKEAEPSIDKEEPPASGTGRRSSPYIHAFTTNLSDSNKRGLDNLTYWSIGPKKSKSYIINQALEQYLAQHKEARKDFPTGDNQGHTLL